MDIKQARWDEQRAQGENKLFGPAFSAQEDRYIASNRLKRVYDGSSFHACLKNPILDYSDAIAGYQTVGLWFTIGTDFQV